MAIISINIKDGSIQRPTETIVGIDLGTTNSLVAYIKDGNPICVKDAAGNNTLVPSIVYFDRESGITVGETAKQMLISDPANTVYSAKRLMGKSYADLREKQAFFNYKIIDDDRESLVKVRIGQAYYTPVELSAAILRALKVRVENDLNADVTKAVITVPAYFNDSQRQATRDAGKLAGLDVLRIVNEPTAAALAYGIGLNPEISETVAVYDLGGGTFDISILQIQDGIFEVLSTNGDTWLGGDDFDQAIAQFWLSTLGSEATDAQEQVHNALRLKAEEAKKALTFHEHFETEFEGKKLSISRSEFEKLTFPLVEKTLHACRQALADAGLQTDQINKVIMVGGSTRVPLVKQSVGNFFGKPVYDSVNPDEIVALGAAIQADILAGNQKNLLLLDITPLSLGIETVGGLMDVIIPRNTKIPARAGRQYTTSVDGQKNLKISVYQGERDLVVNNRKLGEFILKNIPPMPAGLPKIDIAFMLDADGILTVRAKELRSNVEQQIEIKATYGISEEEMALMLLDSIHNAQSDMTVKGLIEARNEAQHLLLSGDKFLEQNKAILSPEEIQTTKDLLIQLKNSMESGEKDVIRQTIEVLNDYTSPLAHRALDSNIGKALKGQKV